MRLHAIGVTLLLILLAGLTPLAQASPPDQTWVWNPYDNAAAADDVVVNTAARGLGSPTQVTAMLLAAEPPLTEPAFRSFYRLRAPPLA